jgi:hypothetical protein
VKKLTVLAIVVVLIAVVAVPSNAQDVELTTKFRSAYLGSTGECFYDGLVQQTYVDLFWKNGIWAEVWTSTGFDTKDNFGKELDLIIGKGGKFGKFNYSTDFEYFFVQGKDIINLNGEISRNFAGGLVSPFVRLEFYAPNQKGGLRKGVMESSGIKSDFKISSKINASIKVEARKDSGCFANDSGMVGQGQIKVSFSLNKKWSITPEFMGMIPLSHRHDGRVADTASGIGLTYKFK